jgi:hypothetical protein
MARGGDGGGIGTVIGWGAAIGGAYLIYRWWSTSTQVPTGAPATNIPPTTTAAANASTPTPSAANVSAMDSIYSQMLAAAAQGGQTGNTNLNADQWGYYLNKVLGQNQAPDSLQLVFNGHNLNRSTNWPTMTSAQYWAAVAPIVAQQRGLQGLGALAGLGRFIAAGRRR